MDTYKPNIGWIFWAQMILVLTVVMILIACIIIWFTHGILIPVLLILLVTVLLSLLVVALTSYTLDEDGMKIRTAFKKYDIQYATVTKVIDTDKGLVNESMLVLSNDRIAVFFGESGKVSISPRKKQEMLDALKAHCPNAVFEEDLKSGVKKDAPAEKSFKPFAFAKKEAPPKEAPAEEAPAEDTEAKEEEPKPKKKLKTYDHSGFKLP